MMNGFRTVRATMQAFREDFRGAWERLEGFVSAETGKGNEHDC